MAPSPSPGASAGPLRPQSYDGTVGPVTGAVSEVFSGPNSPIRDIGFVAINAQHAGGRRDCPNLHLHSGGRLPRVGDAPHEGPRPSSGFVPSAPASGQEA